MKVTNLGSLIKKLEKISKNEVIRANASALNKSAARVNTLVVRALEKDTRIPQKVIRKRVKIEKARPIDQRVVVKIFTRPVPAVHLLTKGRVVKNFGTGTNKRGVTARGHHFPSAFIQRGKGNNFHVFHRIGIFKHAPGPRGGSKKEVIDTIKLKIHDDAWRILNSVAKNVMRKEFPGLLAHELNRRIKKHAKR